MAASSQELEPPGNPARFKTEGQITRLKPIKRQTFGRAKLDLLEARLIGAP